MDPNPAPTNVAIKTQKPYKKLIILFCLLGGLLTVILILLAVKTRLPFIQNNAINRNASESKSPSSSFAPPSSPRFTGTIKSISGNTITVHGSQALPPAELSNQTPPVKDFEFHITNTTLIDKPDFSTPPGSAPPPQKLSLNDLKQGLTVTVSTDNNSNALQIDVVPPVTSSNTPHLPH